MNYFFKNFISSIISGILISIGGLIYLTCSIKFDNGALFGAILFSIGLFSILVYGFNLFTGKVCYFLFEKTKYNLNLITILLGNIIGCFSTGYIFRLTTSKDIINLAEKISYNKINNNILSIFILAIFCGIMIYLAVDIYKNSNHEIAKYTAIILCITIFILCGFEHCIANVFYFSIANAWSLKTWLVLIIMIFGNTVGGSILPLLQFLIKYLDLKDSE